MEQEGEDDSVAARVEGASWKDHLSEVAGEEEEEGDPLQWQL